MARLVYSMSDVPLDHLHRRITAGAPATALKGNWRPADRAIYGLRLGRAPFLQATLAKWGRADSDLCPHCGEAPETTEHYIIDCPRWATVRHKELGWSPEIDCLHGRPGDVLRFIRGTGILPSVCRPGGEEPE